MNRFAIEKNAPMQGLKMLASAYQTRGEMELERAKEKQRMDLRKKTSEVMRTGTPEEVAQFVAENPGAKDIADEVIQFKSEATKRSLVEGAKSRLMGEVEPAQSLREHAELVNKEGGNAKESIGAAIQTMRDPKANEEADLKILAMYDKPSFDALMEMRKTTDTQGGETTVGSQEILEDGTIIQSTPKGPVVYNPQGEKVTGEAAAEAIATARAEKVSNLRKAAGEKKAATLKAEQELKGTVEAGVISQKEAAKISAKAFDRLENINTNLSNLEEGIGLLREEGANTGVIDKFLPSLKTATIKMDNLQGRLGLDVLNTTTFGALSAGELKFALDTAVPKGLQPKELADWMEEKKKTQEKLADYIESAAIYLGTPGNTVAGWIEKKRDERLGGVVVIKAHPKFGDVTEADIQATMKTRGKTREEVLTVLGGK